MEIHVGCAQGFCQCPGGLGCTGSFSAVCRCLHS